MKNQDEIIDKQKNLPASFDSLHEAAEFWDTHDSSDYEDMMEFVDFEINIQRRAFMIPIDEELLKELRKKATSQGLSTETLVNLLLQKHA